MLYFVLLNSKNKEKVFVHRAVAMLFVDHIDRNRQNNKVENLRWCTQSENLQNRTFSICINVYTKTRSEAT